MVTLNELKHYLTKVIAITFSLFDNSSNKKCTALQTKVCYVISYYIYYNYSHEIIKIFGYIFSFLYQEPIHSLFDSTLELP